MKRFIIFQLFLFFISFKLTAQIPREHPDNDHPTKVACIGTSITYGATIVNMPRDSYPAQLGRLLGTQWKVRNFGVNGRTMLKKGNLPYWNTPVFEQAMEFLPDVIIIELGTNDSKPQNWKYKSEFYDDYKDMINGLLALKSSPKI